MSASSTSGWPAIAPFLAGSGAKDCGDVIEVAFHHLHQPVTASRTQVGDCAFQKVAEVVQFVVVAQVRPAVLRLALQIPAIEITIRFLGLFQIVDDRLDLCLDHRVAAVGKGVGGGLDPFADVAVPEDLGA